MGLIGKAARAVLGLAICCALAAGGLTGPAALAQTLPPEPQAQAAPPAHPQQVLLRLSGSNTIGARLAPALAEGYLAARGLRDIETVEGDSPEDRVVRGTRGGVVQAIRIGAHGTATAFDALDRDLADIGMASRRIRAEEAARLAALGDMTGPSNEHVLALDGIAVIVHRSNPVSSLSRDQVAAIFNGMIGDWRQVGGRPGPITVYARDDRSGTFDTFKALVLGTTALTPSAQRFEDSAALVAAITGDVGGIGFVGLPYIGLSKALAIGELDAVPLLPNAFTVATEDYPLSRRLFLYTAAAPRNPDVANFIEFALSRAGQDIVRQVGFVPLTVQSEAAAAPRGAPAEYARLTAGGLRLSLNFRFRTGSADLDNRAVRDLDRVVEFLQSLGRDQSQVILIGFADSRGRADANLRLSRQRAQAVADEFRRRGVQAATVTGFGAELPVAGNDTEDGREKNRRVEIWVRTAAAMRN